MKFFFVTLFGMMATASMLAPQPGMRDMEGARCMALLPQCMGDTSATRPSDYCVQCQYLDRGIYPSVATPMPSYYPWWYGYGMYQYPSYYSYPGVWNNGGLSNHYYPGPGNMAAGKPNIYFHGLENGQEFDFKISYKEKANELSTSPIHSKNGWSIKKSKDGLVVDGTNYNYLYYDYKLDSNKLQSEAGFCGDEKSVYKKMVSVLNTMKFKKAEVDDFENYWAFKIPKGEYCVFPQEHQELNEIAAWQSSIQPQFYKRVLFALIPKDQILAKKGANFTKIPESDWNPMRGIYRNVAQADSKFQIHEWGVAFLTK
ncbi:hypothetical protein [Bacteriovorax sp. Seq25_V]|uniref:hypothetical protein n=1 Tax=Bacteriovorax sp. Seq25_V TaxID=1201288 RepID=UPI00038A54D2|nr:hypothetical protein [Bacteriovorax sp. Seq25_V]EQC43775.1 hypothetical protein M900_1398 [Bacteriovorax sp. Seq25_V]